MKKSDLPAARMKHNMLLQQPVLTSDGLGGYTKTWQDVAELWAELKQMSGSETYGLGQIGAHQTYKIYIRSRSDITSDMRLLYEGRVFNIRSIIYPLDNEKDRMQIVAEEGVAA